MFVLWTIIFFWKLSMFKNFHRRCMVTLLIFTSYISVSQECRDTSSERAVQSEQTGLRFGAEILDAEQNFKLQ